MDKLPIKGVLRTSMLDYPDKLSCVIFLGYCNMRCPFCHNPELVLDPEKLPDIKADEILSYLAERKKWLDGIVLTGGEPTLHKGLIPFLREVKSMGLLVKLDTNGTNPDMIEALLKDGLVDYIAMDIKASLENYAKAAGISVDKAKILKSISLIIASGVDYEFRSTVLPGLFDSSEAKKIGEMLKGAKKFCLQQYRNSDKVIDEKFQNVNPFRPDDMRRFGKILEPYFELVEIRGI